MVTGADPSRCHRPGCLAGDSARTDGVSGRAAEWRTSPLQQGAQVISGIPPWFLVFIDPGWWNEFGDAIGGEDDRPVTFMDFGMMMPAK